MYYQDYDEYMRNVLGYNVQNSNSYNPYQNEDYYGFRNIQPDQEEITENEEWYPEIYRTLNPMVCKACNEVHTKDITEEMVNQITDNIFVNIEINDEVEQKQNKNGDVPNPNARGETRQLRPNNNPLLRDLIKILVLQKLFKRRPPMRPPMPPPRPPFPGNRPPMPRGPYEDLYY